MRQAMGAMIIQKRMGQKRPRPGEGDSRETRTTSSSEAGADGVAGTLILDATCSPVDSRFPQDFSRLNEAREKTDEIIDVLHRQVAAKGERHPRTYREVIRKAYLGMAKAKARGGGRLTSRQARSTASRCAGGGLGGPLGKTGSHGGVRPGTRPTESKSSGS